MLNTVQLIGNVGSVNPAEKVVRLNVAVNRNVKQGDSWEKETDWITVTLFGHSADFAKARRRRSKATLRSSRRYRCLA